MNNAYAIESEKRFVRAKAQIVLRYLGHMFKYFETLKANKHD